jgi:hypothetical protein
MADKIYDSAGSRITALQESEVQNVRKQTGRCGNTKYLECVNKPIKTKTKDN